MKLSKILGLLILCSNHAMRTTMEVPILLLAVGIVISMVFI